MRDELRDLLAEVIAANEYCRPEITSDRIIIGLEAFIRKRGLKLTPRPLQEKSGEHLDEQLYTAAWDAAPPSPWEKKDG